jgi:hypothetical protein
MPSSTTTGAAPTRSAADLPRLSAEKLRNVLVVGETLHARGLPELGLGTQDAEHGADSQSGTMKR